MLAIKRILCPIDFSEPSLAALDAAAQWAQHFDAELQVLHVLPLLTPDILIDAPNMLPADKKRCQEAWEEIRDILKRHLSPEVRVRSDVRIGEPAQEILDAASNDEVSLLILATHGRTGWRHFVFGSVAETVVRKAACPVLTIHASGAAAPPHVKA